MNLPDSSSASRATLIHLKNVRKTYQMGNEKVHALDGISLTIEKNEYVAVMGPSGSGKSTLMNVLGCLDTPTEGTYLLNGQDVSSMRDNELAEVRNREIGFIFQSFNLLARTTAVQNVELPLIYAGVSRSERRQRAEEALRKVGLGERMDHTPAELSGGQRQRVAVARALVSEPSILLADEPTGNLDSTTSHDIMTLMEELYQMGNTIVVVTHEDDIAAHARRLIALKDGFIERDVAVQDPALAAQVSV